MIVLFDPLFIKIHTLLLNIFVVEIPYDHIVFTSIDTAYLLLFIYIYLLTIHSLMILLSVNRYRAHRSRGGDEDVLGGSAK